MATDITPNVDAMNKAQLERSLMMAYEEPITEAPSLSEFMNPKELSVEALDIENYIGTDIIVMDYILTEHKEYGAQVIMVVSIPEANEVGQLSAFSWGLVQQFRLITAKSVPTPFTVQFKEIPTSQGMATYQLDLSKF